MNSILHYHRRHGLNCTGKHPAGSFTSEPEERKKGWGKCQCLIYANGSLRRVAKRFATKRADWQEARDLMAPYLAADSWDLGSDQPPTPSAPSTPKLAVEDDEGVPERAPGKRASIQDAISLFLDEYDEAAHNTQKLCRYATANLMAYAEKIGLRYVHEWEDQFHVRQLRKSWGVGPATQRKKLANVKTFFEFCVEQKWINYNPARIKAKRGARATGVSTQRLPFTDEELDRMYAGCSNYGTYKDTGRHHKWNGQDLSDFIALSVHTGMRISDIATFHVERLLDNGSVHIRTIKSQGQTKVYTWVPEDIAQMIRERGRKFGPYIFGTHATTIIDNITDPWRERLNLLWEQTGPWTARPVHHRFRHTFARILLENGVEVSEVAQLMGNTEDVVRKYYKAWVPELQQRTITILREAFKNIPRPSRTPRQKVQAIKQA